MPAPRKIGVRGGIFEDVCAVERATGCIVKREVEITR